MWDGMNAAADPIVAVRLGAKRAPAFPPRCRRHHSHSQGKGTWSTSTMFRTCTFWKRDPVHRSPLSTPSVHCSGILLAVPNIEDAVK
jgi:hypothetical protein